MHVFRTVLFTVIGPSTVAGLLPYIIHASYPNTLALALGPARWLGVPVTVAGVLIYLATAGAFALIGRGTPSPTHPTETLVVQGLHRYVRNPMYVGVLSVILGQALWFQSGLLIVYAAAFLTAFNTFILLYEEPTLRRTYGDQYARYCEATPRWIPRFGKR